MTSTATPDVIARIDPISSSIQSMKDTINTALFSSDLSLMCVLIGIFLFIGLGSVILFENVLHNIRTQFTNTSVGIFLAIVFVVIIFRFMGKSTVFFGKEFDLGMIYYILIITFSMVLFSG